jgi:hypothetical protein
LLPVDLQLLHFVWKTAPPTAETTMTARATQHVLGTRPAKRLKA